MYGSGDYIADMRNEIDELKCEINSLKLKLIINQNFKIVESIHGNFYYHLSEDNKSTLCGKDEFLITQLPIKTWGYKSSHIGERYCKDCERKAIL